MSEQLDFYIDGNRLFSISYKCLYAGIYPALQMVRGVIMKNKIQKTLVGMFVGVTSFLQVGCVGFPNIDACDRSSRHDGTYEGVINESNFSNELTVNGTFSESCDEGTFIEEFILTIDSHQGAIFYWSSQSGKEISIEEIQTFSEVLNDYNPVVVYDVSSSCESIPDSETLPENIDCEFHLTSSDDSQTIDINYTISLTE